MNARVTLRGITWDHARGYEPLVAATRVLRTLPPHIDIQWDRRPLQAFEEFPLEQLAPRYDLMVIDHPFVGYAARHGVLLPLDEHLPAPFLAEQAANSVGRSHASYLVDGHLWALAIDAAAPVALWRDDLLAALGLEAPPTWEALLTLARRGHVEVPGAPINCLMHFFMLSLVHGETPCATPDHVVAPELGRDVLACLGELLHACAPGCWSRNPIASHELLASAENRQIAYCAFAYGYSNYARDGFAAHRLSFGELPTFRGRPLCPTLGGTGLAVSALSSHPTEAVASAQFIASAEIQRTIYTAAGGQPAKADAWRDATNNILTHDMLARTLPVVDRAWLRPRHDGYMKFQERAGSIIHGALRGSIRHSDALEQVNALYRASLPSPILLT